ncbi:50S ribosomal protein L29 [Pedobacter glucosidilyticus]|jgi:large subunit ribosomal protein L29|uniref:Large ribosomal subunit protein uL29 n=1 Tax=Pedobacter aquae TaxID=2605747 RepID=A0A5C0VBZ4_9SPHI|nr:MULTISPECIES: 50S ribosomal protein L29 [Pedobacter]KHJ37236.1 50S ribosomal protein L29 [Pedobacter glucosidilyticus]QEK50278.1 50S ribosomal protein L29 [Pedobacter aquae]
MKYAEIKALATNEIVARIQEEKATMTKLKFAHAVSSIENPTRIHNSRKIIARLSTELTQRQAQAKAASESNS